MYGLLLEAIYDYVRNHMSEETWAEIVAAAGISQSNYITHGCYGEEMLGKIAEAASEVTGLSIEELMENFGVHFVTFVGKYGYDTILRVLGRNMRDFLNGLDNLHDHLRLSYPKMQAPSFFCENETKNSLMLHYRSKRKGFIHYVIGQIRQVGLLFYETQIEVEIVKQEESAAVSHVILKLHFDNKGYTLQRAQKSICDLPRMKSEMFFRCFPFHIVFGRDMTIRHVGKGLQAALPDLLKKRLDHAFDLCKPPIDFTYENVRSYTNNIFQLESISEVKRRVKLEHKTSTSGKGRTDAEGVGAEASEDDLDGSYFHVLLKGQMRYVPAWDAFIYMANPVLDTLEKMYHLGLYINDLSMHDASRDMVLLGTVHSKELKSALNEARHKSRKLEEIVRLLDMEIKRSDSLLYQMIPKEVADSLRFNNGSNTAVDTCQVMDKVTLLFSEVIDFNAICARISPMEVVNILNSMYSKFDNLTEVHRVYKVETIGDAYMVVSGAPVPNKLHALMMCDMALDMLDAVQSVPNPATDNEHILIRIGVHSGTVVAGVVGLRMPRYCLFGDAVNTASRMESNSLPMKIHISEKSANCLKGYPYQVEEREGLVNLKGKGKMRTYWLTGRIGPGCSQLYEQSPVTERRSSRRGSSRLDIYSSFGDEDHSSRDRAGSRLAYTPVGLEQKPGSPVERCDSGVTSAVNYVPSEDGAARPPRVDVVSPATPCGTKVCSVM